MLLLAFVLLGIGTLLLLAGLIRVMVGAFQESIVWGLCVLLLPFANLIFMMAHWGRAKGGTLCSLGGVVLMLGAWSVENGFERHGGKLPPNLDRALNGATPAPAARSGVADAGIFKAQKDAELQLKLVNLHTRETELLQRKAELTPGDKKAAAALAAEIKKYNDDLQPVLAQQKAAAPPHP